MTTYRQSLVLQEGCGPHVVTVLHHDGTMSRMEIDAAHTELRVCFTIAEGKVIHVEGLPV